MGHEITSARLVLRPVRPSDVDAVHALVSDFEVVRQTATWPWPADRAFTETRCAPVDPALGIAGPVLLDGRIVGMMGVLAEGDHGGLGYMFARAVWGQGFATEIGRALLAHVWARQDWDIIEAGVFDGNPASARVLEKLGFSMAGQTRQNCAAEGRVRPLAQYRLPRP